MQHLCSIVANGVALNVVCCMILHRAGCDASDQVTTGGGGGGGVCVCGGGGGGVTPPSPSPQTYINRHSVGT